MRRTKLNDRQLPDYTHSEELFNMITHIVGGGFAVVITALCIVFSAIHGDPWAVVGSAVYGASMIALYSVSSVYHGILPAKERAKKVMQVIDHCMVYFLIAGTYTPILLTAIRRESPVACWVLFAVVWGLTALAVTLTAIDLKRYSKFSMICYIAIGWSVVFILPITLRAISLPGFLFLLAGGIVYSIGAVLYHIGKRKRFMHSIFHLFVLVGTLLQFFCIFFYVI